MTKKSETRNHSENENEKTEHSNGRSRRGNMRRGNKSGHSFAAGFSWGEVDDEDQPEMLIPAKKKRRRKKDADHPEHFPSTLSAVHSTPASDPYPIADKKSWTVPRLTPPAEKPKLAMENDLTLPSYGRPLLDQEEDEFIKRLLNTADEEEDLVEKTEGKRRKKSSREGLFSKGQKKLSANTSSDSSRIDASTTENLDTNLNEKNKRKSQNRLNAEGSFDEKSQISNPSGNSERKNNLDDSHFNNADLNNPNSEDVTFNSGSSERKSTNKFSEKKIRNSKTGFSRKKTANIAEDERSDDHFSSENSSLTDDNAVDFNAENPASPIKNKRTANQTSRKRSVKVSKTEVDSLECPFENDENLSKRKSKERARKTDSVKVSNRSRTSVTDKANDNPAPATSNGSEALANSARSNGNTNENPISCDKINQNGNLDNICNINNKSISENISGQVTSDKEEISKNELLSLRSRSLRLLKKSGISSELLDNLARTKNLSPVQLLHRFLVAILEVNNDTNQPNSNAKKSQTDSLEVSTAKTLEKNDSRPLERASLQDHSTGQSETARSARFATDLFSLQPFEVGSLESEQFVSNRTVAESQKDSLNKIETDSVFQGKTTPEKNKSNRSSLDIPFGDIPIEKTVFMDLTGEDRREDHRKDLSSAENPKRSSTAEKEKVPEKKIIPVSEDPAITVWEEGFSRKKSVHKSPVVNLKSEELLSDSAVLSDTSAKIPMEEKQRQQGKVSPEAGTSDKFSLPSQETNIETAKDLPAKSETRPKTKKGKSRIKAVSSDESVELSKKSETRESTPKEFHFGDLKLSKTMLEALHDADYDSPTPVQAGTFNRIMAGKDLIGQAQTGTGKTAAFLIPLLEQVDQCEPGNDPVALIIVPTRELAVQVRDEGLKLAQNRECDIVAVYGGKPIADQIKKLRAGVDIAVGTPGRIIDLVSRRALNFNSLRWVILDEADRMLDIGFRPDIEKILRQTPKNRQTLLFSATLPDSVIHLAKKYMTDPETCDFSASEIASETIEQYYISVDRERKFDALIRLLEVEKPTQAIVFCRTKRAVDRIGHHLAGVMQGTGVIHGDLSQESRDRIMKEFRSGKVRTLVATDVVGRGIDISGISHIINYDIPQFCDDYVHRVGRTGRMGREGVAFTLVTSEEGAELTRIEKRINLQLKRRELPDFVAYAKPVHEAEEEKPAPKPVFGSSRRTIRRAL